MLREMSSEDGWILPHGNPRVTNASLAIMEWDEGLTTHSLMEWDKGLRDFAFGGFY